MNVAAPRDTAMCIVSQSGTLCSHLVGVDDLHAINVEELMAYTIVPECTSRCSCSRGLGGSTPPAPPGTGASLGGRPP
jgi:hypothetical protein